jgi:RimJ/RimL family protein N-acetyltransferase
VLDLQPSLIGERTRLRPLEASDFENLCAVASDPLIWEQHSDKSRSTRTGFETFFSQALASRGSLVVVDGRTGNVIGCTRYHQYVPGPSVTIGYTFLARAYWGGPTNREMKRLTIEHAFTDVSKVMFCVAEGNTRSRRAVEKLGAALIGTEEAPRFGQLHVLYRLTPELWRLASD